MAGEVSLYFLISLKGTRFWGDQSKLCCFIFTSPPHSNLKFCHSKLLVSAIFRHYLFIYLLALLPRLDCVQLAEMQKNMFGRSWALAFVAWFPVPVGRKGSVAYACRAALHVV